MAAARATSAERKKKEAKDEAFFVRMPLFSKKRNARISGYDVILYRPSLAAQELSLDEPVPPLYNGIDGVVIIKALYKGHRCAVRFQGLNGNIANEKRDPIHNIDDRSGWNDFISGLRRGMAYKFGPEIYTVFTTEAGLVPYRDKRNIVQASVKTILLGVDAVELMKGTFIDYAVDSFGELNIDDFNQFVELYTRMRTAYASVYPKFPKDLHGNNCMYKLDANGRRVWLWTDIDESPSYMVANYKTPREMAVHFFNWMGRPDALLNPAPVPPKKNSSPRRNALPVVPAPSPKRRPGVPTSSDIARQEAKAQELLRKRKNFPVVAPEGTNMAARPAVRKPVRTLAQAKSSRKKSMSDAKVVSRKKSRSPIKPYSPMIDAKVISKPKRKSSRQLKPYAPLDAYAGVYANLGY